MIFPIPRLAVFALAFASVVAQAQDQIRTDLDTVARAIVAVDATIADRALLGAGVVAMRERDAVIVVTANHVVRQGATEASRLLVRFKDKPQQALAATLLPGFDRTDDIAAFRVEHLREQGVDPCALPMLSFDSVQVVRRGHGVFPIGNPAGVPWRIPVTPDTVTEVTARGITFQSALIDSGHSGGGLFNAYGDLVGIIRADQPPYGVATRADRAWALLRGWVPAGPNDACASPSATPASAAAAAPIDASRAALAQAWIDDPAFDVASWRPLFVAVRGGDVEAVRRLATRDILNADYHPGPFPLHLAAELGQVAVVKQLILMGAKKNEYLGFPAPGDPLGASMGTPLHMAVRTNQVETIRLLIASGAFVNDTEHEGANGAYSPLATAAAEGRLEAAQALIAAGASLMSRHGSEFSPIGQAVIHGHVDMIQLLRRAGASLATPSSTDDSPYTTLAVRYDQLDALRYLLSAKAPTACPANSTGCGAAVLTALSTEVVGKISDTHLQALQMLLAAGANPNGDGFTSYIDFALQMREPAAVKALLRAGANPNAKNRDGKSMLALALAADDNDAVSALKAFGAKP